MTHPLTEALQNEYPTNQQVRLIIEHAEALIAACKGNPALGSTLTYAQHLLSSYELISDNRKLPTVVYAVPWIESEFGQRDEGYFIYTSREEARIMSEAAVARGTYDGGYYGPEQPLRAYEVAFSDLKLPEDDEDWFLQGNSIHVNQIPQTAKKKVDISKKAK